MSETEALAMRWVPSLSGGGRRGAAYGFGDAELTITALTGRALEHKRYEVGRAVSAQR